MARQSPRGEPYTYGGIQVWDDSYYPQGAQGNSYVYTPRGGAGESYGQAESSALNENGDAPAGKGAQYRRASYESPPVTLTPRGQLSDLVASNQRLQQQLELSKGKITEQEGEIEYLKSQLTAACEDATLAIADVRRMETRLNEMGEDRRLSASMGSTSSTPTGPLPVTPSFQVATLKAEYEGRLVVQEKEIARLQALVDKAIADSDKGAKHELELENRLEQATRQIEELEDDCRAQAAEIRELKSTNARLRAELTAFREDVDDRYLTSARTPR